jgi:hypothetical protein
MKEAGSQRQELCLTEDELAQIEAKVHGRLQGRVRDLRLLVRGDGLVLRGRSHCYYVKQLAQHSVMAVTQIRILANEIEVP